MNEATRLARLLGLTQCCAPIYALSLRLIAHMAARVARAVVDPEEDGITAALVLERDGREEWLPCHLADAVALAMMAGAPIDASGAAMDHACPLGRCTTHPIHASDAARWLANVRPDDFAARERPEG